MIASSFMDPVLGLDVHFEMVPTPAPVPTPIPNPFTGIVFDPVGLAAGIALGAAIGAVMGAPFQGPVLYWTAFPATNTGTEAKHIPGHILIPPGTAWAPFPKTPKPVIHPGETPKPALPVKPENDAVVVFGSKTVTVMGSNAVRMGDIALSCSEPLRLPSSVVLAVPKGAPILIGGPMSLDIMAAVMASLRTRFVSDSLHALISRLRPSRFRNLLHRAVCFFTGHPVDVASGKVMTEYVDVDLPGPMPLVVERIYSSAFASRSGPFGHGWSHSLDQAVWRERGKVVLLTDDGREIEFDTFGFPNHSLEAGQRVYNPIERLTLHCDRGGVWRVVNEGGVTRYFAPVPGRDDGRAVLHRIVPRDGEHQISLSYDVAGRLAKVVDACDRTVTFRYDSSGRVTELLLPNPEGHGHDRHRRYEYDAAGDLVRVTDALGNAWSFFYETHLLTQETDRNGLSFYFSYDGMGEDAWCVRTWGDKGIHDHILRYDKKKHVTFVTDSRGYTTQYHMNLVGQVVKLVDPLGAKTTYTYDPHTLLPLEEVDALGRRTVYEYDKRGNNTKIVLPEGTSIDMVYDQHDQLVHATDVGGYTWRWRYDARGRLLESTDGDGSRTSYRYGERGDLAAIIEAGRFETRFVHDRQGLLASILTPDGGESKRRHDALGRAVEVRDPLGNVQRRRFDLQGRLREIHEPDGNVRRLEYDGEGNLVHAKDAQLDVRFTYTGRGRVASRTEAGTTVHFEYDTEEQLTAVVNAHGRVYAFERDERGDVASESGFDSIRKLYSRDAEGQITKIERASGNTTTYEYDAAGRIVEVQHSDGTSEHYRYRRDGELVEASNNIVTARFERDAAGRITCEWQNEHWVRSSYDPRGYRQTIRSSFGMVQEIERNAMGGVVGMRYRDVSSPDEAWAGDPARATWEARIERDLLGEELDRCLPGGARSVWSRDRLGRPAQHRIFGGRAVVRDVGYEWTVNDHLHKIVNHRRDAATTLGHDRLGNLIWAQYDDGMVDFRMPDAVGNLFRRQSRDDREYGPAGQLLAAATHKGVRRYVYDADGNLSERHEPDGGVWRYTWSAGGNLIRVQRPDGEVVEFDYDALGRRVAKHFDGKTTRWVWDQAVPLHEWIEEKLPASSDEDEPELRDVPGLATEHLEEVLAGREVRGPPELAWATEENGLEEVPVGLITWIFDPESYAPAAKIVDGQRYSIVTDHIGAPVAMLDADGQRVWSAQLGAYGQLRELETVEGIDRHTCPFRWPGQYEDAETGLYYNRFRYYDPEAGQYTSQDPLGLEGSLELYAYVHSPFELVDPEGLAATLDRNGYFARSNEYAKGKPGGGRSTRVTIPYQGTRGRDFTQANKAAGFRQTPAGYTWHHVNYNPKTGHGRMQLVRKDVHAARSHSGGVSRFQKAHKVKYGRNAVKVVKARGLLRGRPPKKKKKKTC